jgi:hypothetical protein
MMKKYSCVVADKGGIFKKGMMVQMFCLNSRLGQPGIVYILNDCVVVTKQMKDNSEKLRKTGILFASLKFVSCLLSGPLGETEVHDKKGT